VRGRPGGRCLSDPKSSEWVDGNDRNGDVRGERMGSCQHAHLGGSRQPSRWISGMPLAGRGFRGDPTAPAERRYRSGPHIAIGAARRITIASIRRVRSASHTPARAKRVRAENWLSVRAPPESGARPPRRAGARNSYPEVSASAAGWKGGACRCAPGRKTNWPAARRRMSKLSGYGSCRPTLVPDQEPDERSQTVART
jgi:hypothetical protein